MRKLCYVSLEYAESDLDEAGSQCIAAIWESCEQNFTFRGYVLRDWKDIVSATSESDRDYIEEFIYELKQLPHKHSNVAEQFFCSVQGLGVGPLRTAATGTIELSDAECRPFDLDAYVKEVVFCDRERFHDVLSKLSHSAR